MTATTPNPATSQLLSVDAAPPRSSLEALDRAQRILGRSACRTSRHCNARVLLVHGDALRLLPRLKAAGIAADLVLTDPPYASGGLQASQRCAPPSQKYAAKKRYHGDFAGDQRDQRSWTAWCERWLSLLPLREGSRVMSFIDWRQLPALSDAVGAAELRWRGVIVWDKTEAGSRVMPHGWPRHQCEYICWATKGCVTPDGHRRGFAGCYRHRLDPREKLHQTAKPLALMRDLVQQCQPGGLVLDPFAGSATTAAAAALEGRACIAIEKSEEIFNIAERRLAALELPA